MKTSRAPNPNSSPQKPRLPIRITRTLATVRKNLDPPTVRFGLEVRDKARTFSLELNSRRIVLPPFWNKFTDLHLEGFLGHEHKHGSLDGLPYTFLNSKKHQAAAMASLNLPNAEVRRLLNCVYDAVINVRLFEGGFPMRETQQAWVDMFPVTAAEGEAYHLLQLVHKHFLKIALPPTAYESRVEAYPAFEQLLQTLSDLVRQQDGLKQEKDVGTVVKAVDLFRCLCESVSSDEGDPSLCSDGGEPTPDDARGDVAEAALDAGLDAKQLKDLLNDTSVSEEDARRLLEEAEESKARTGIWHSLMGFDRLHGDSGRPIYERELLRWRGRSVHRLDPMSVVLHRSEPSRWREKARRQILTVPHQGGTQGFEEVIVVLDISGSTKILLKGRMVFAYEQDVVHSAIAFARKHSLPVSVITFESRTATLALREKDHLKAAVLVSRLKATDGNSELWLAVERCLALSPKKALVAMVTDGGVSTTSLSPILKVSSQNEVVCMVVTADSTSNRFVEAVGGKLTTYWVRPDEAGRVMLDRLGRIESRRQ
jgi:hypothetical protein